jgi:serine/alanine adding enzyme
MHHGPPDVYFTRGYGLAVAEVEDGTCIELADGNWQVPLLVRPLASGRSDAVSPYGYAGVFAGPGLSASDIEDLWRQTRDELRRRGVVAAFVRESPLVNQAHAPADAIPVVTGHATFHIPCRPATEVWDAMAGSCRTWIRRADKSGTTVTLAPATRNELASASDFRRLYEGTMDKVDARDYYFFGDSYYEALLAGLGEDLLVGTARDPEGQALVAALFIEGHANPALPPVRRDPGGQPRRGHEQAAVGGHPVRDRPRAGRRHAGRRRVGRRRPGELQTQFQGRGANLQRLWADN